MVSLAHSNRRFFRLHALSLALALLLGACAAPKVEETSPSLAQQIADADRNGRLEQLYDDWAAKPTGEGSEMSTRLKEVGSRLASQRAEVAQALLKDARLPSGLVPLDVIERAAQTAQPMQRWSAVAHQEMAKYLAAEKTKAVEALEQLHSNYPGLKEEDVVSRFNNLTGQIQLLGSSTEGQETGHNRETLLGAAYDKAVAAMDGNRLDEADVLLDGISQVRPGYRETQRLSALVRIKQFETSVRKKRDPASLDAQMNQYQTLTQRTDFDSLRPALIDAVTLLVENMRARAGVEQDSDNLLASYRWLRKVHDLDKTQGLQSRHAGQEKRFVDLVLQLAEAAAKTKDQQGLALGYLLSVQKLVPDHPALKRLLGPTQRTVVDSSATWISVESIEENGSRKDGLQIVSLVNERLGKEIPMDAKLVDRKLLDALAREAQLRGEQFKPRPADYLFKGEVLQAIVENTENKSTKVVRAVTHRELIPNPEYEAWDRSGRRSDAAPPPKIEMPISEDIRINISLQRKAGSLSMLYSITGSNNESVLIDTITRKKVVSGESSEGVQLGEYQSPMKVADLPSDTEILSNLGQEIAGAIGDKLIAFLRDSEIRYEADARRLMTEDNAKAAVEKMAKAWALSQAKGKDAEKLGTELRRLSLGLRPDA